jgi:hypothetical protein
MNLVNYITTVLLSLQPTYGDGEAWQQRVDRMSIIAQAIDDASSKATCSDKYESDKTCVRTWPKEKKSLALLLITMGYWESKFAKNVHEGKCRKYECDPSVSASGTVYHKARSPWQIQKTGLVNQDEYKIMNSSSLESTTMSANVAVRYLSMGMKQCGTFHGAMAIYGGAGSCSWPGVNNREAFYRHLLEKTPEQLNNEIEKQKASFKPAENQTVLKQESSK